MSDGFVDIDDGRQIASSYRGGEDVVDGLKNSAHETPLNGNEGLVAIGLVEQSGKDGSERFRRHSLPKVGETRGEVLSDISGEADWQVVSDDSVDGVEKQRVLVGPMPVDG